MQQEHNLIRSRFRLPPLIWSNKLAAVAQQWADELIARSRFVHRPRAEYGENLFEADGGRASAKEVVDQWALEARNYDYKTNRCRGVCGHYTQIIWRDTMEIGCGVSRSSSREVWVCNYDPPGNFAGRRPY